MMLLDFNSYSGVFFPEYCTHLSPAVAGVG